MERTLRGQTALITGASSGIGAAIARQFATAGARLILTARRLDLLEKLASSLSGYPIRVLACDLVNDPELEYLIVTVKKEFPELDILVNNAGIGRFSPIDDLKWPDLDLMMRLNLRVPVLLTQAFVPEMKRRGGGRIINLSSIAGKVGAAGGSAYAATKSGLEGFSKSLYDELRDSNISVTTINPGSVDTPFFDDQNSTLLRENMLRPIDVAEVALFIATRPSSVLIDSIELRPRKKPR